MTIGERIYGAAVSLFALVIAARFAIRLLELRG